MATLVNEHLARLSRALGSELGVVRTNLFVGDWAVLSDALATVCGGDVYRADRWRRALGELTQRLQKQLSDQETSVLRPPLFPVPDNPMVLGGMIVDVEDLLVSMPVESQDLLWSVASDADRDFWSEMFWVLARGDDDSSPFEMLLLMYERGLFSVGIAEDQFIVFALASS